MHNLTLTQAPKAETGMLIRKPVADVFNAFIDPAITTQFWFTRSSGKLEPGKQVVWEWEMYNASAPVTVKAIDPNRRILIEWGDAANLSTVEWLFTPHSGDTTFVTITNTDFLGDADQLVAQATDSAQGFSFVLAGLKALLEHGIRLNLTADRFPTRD
jgi:uncharacterized protein YndB with AHSA1/START domain